MNLTIPYSADDHPTLNDVILRLRVLYPNLQISSDTHNIVINGADQSLEENIKQTALDQLIRSKFDARTIALRENLYKKLLG